MKDTNYYVIHGWMRNRLGLKGNHLPVYAIIYGFSQDNDSKFYGSADYIAECIGISGRAVETILKTLLSDGLIEKEKVTIKGCVTKVIYSVTSEETSSVKGESTSEDFSPTSEETSSVRAKKLQNTSEVSSPYNNNLYINLDSDSKISKRARFIPPTFHEVEEYAKSKDALYLAKPFFEYFTADEDPSKHWVDKRGDKVKNWKQKFISWLNRNEKPPQSHITPQGTPRRESPHEQLRRVIGGGE